MCVCVCVSEEGLSPEVCVCVSEEGLSPEVCMYVCVS